MLDLATLTAADLIGKPVITWGWDGTLTYEGPDPAAPDAELLAAGQSGGAIRTTLDRVAPADTLLADTADPRLEVVKLARKVHPWDPGVWQLRLPGHTPTAHKTKRDAVAAGRRRLAIIDWNAQREAAVRATDGHDAGVDGPVYERGTCRACGARVMRRLDGNADVHMQSAWGVDNGRTYGATNCPARAGEPGTEATPHDDVVIDGQEDEDLNRCSNGCVCTVAERIAAGHGDDVIAEWRSDNDGDPENHDYRPSGAGLDESSPCLTCGDNGAGLLHAFDGSFPAGYFDEAILQAAVDSEQAAEVAQQVVDEQTAQALEAADPEGDLQQDWWARRGTPRPTSRSTGSVPAGFTNWG